MSLSPICHCQVSPAEGRHHVGELGEEVEGKRISVVGEAGKSGDESFSPVESASQEDKVADAINAARTKILNRMMFELRQVVFMLGEEFVGHLANLGEG